MRFQLKLPQIQKIMMEFEKQSEIMDMKEEMMNDAIDDAMGDEDDEEERFEMLTLLSWSYCSNKNKIEQIKILIIIIIIFITVFCQQISVMIQHFKSVLLHDSFGNNCRLIAITALFLVFAFNPWDLYYKGYK